MGRGQVGDRGKQIKAGGRAEKARVSCGRQLASSEIMCSQRGQLGRCTAAVIIADIVVCTNAITQTTSRGSLPIFTVLPDTAGCLVG